jgi:phosphatidylserine decarboxylase
MSLHRSAGFLAAYRFLPHRLINRAAGRLARARRPRWLVEAAIRAWVARERIDLADFAPARWDTVEEFFLRRLRPGARPLGPGLVSPVDGTVVASGEVTAGARLVVKGRTMSLARLLGEATPEAWLGGRYLSLFLSPRGYHYVHMPADGELASCRWIAGRYFPQNEDALAHLDAVYERNERAVLHLRLDGGGGMALVMVGASLIGGIHLAGAERARWARPGTTPLGLDRARGEELGHFTFGSTVVLVLPPGLAGAPRHAVGASVRMGETLFAPA